MLTLYKLHEYIVYPGKIDDRPLIVRYHKINQCFVGVYKYKRKFDQIIVLYISLQQIIYECVIRIDDFGDEKVEITINMFMTNEDKLTLTNRIVNGKLDYQNIKIRSKKPKFSLPVWHG